MEYPTYVEYQKIDYKINYDFRIALKCMKIIDDENIEDMERTIAVVTLLFGVNIPVNEETLRLTRRFLQCGSDENKQKSTTIKDMDYDQDSSLIEASFMSDYSIDLSLVEEMHWWKFCNLISGLKPDCILNRVRELRNYDVGNLKDEKNKHKIIDAKQRVALKAKTSKEEQEMLDEFEKLFI